MKRSQLLLFLIVLCFCTGLQAAEVGFRGFWQNWVYYTPESAWHGGGFLRIFPTINIRGAQTFSMLVDFDTYDTRRSPNLDFRVYDFRINYSDTLFYNKDSRFTLQLGTLSVNVPDVFSAPPEKEIKGMSVSNLKLGNATASSFMVWPRNYSYEFGTHISWSLGETILNTTFASAPQYKLFNNEYLLDEPLLKDQALLIKGSRFITSDIHVTGLLGFNIKDAGTVQNQKGTMKKIILDFWGVPNSTLTVSLADYDPEFSPKRMDREQIKYLNDITDSKYGVFFFGTDNMSSLFNKQKVLKRSFIGQRGFKVEWSTIGLPINVDFFGYERTIDNQTDELLETLTYQASTKLKQKTLSVGYSVQNQVLCDQMFGFNILNQNKLFNMNITYPLGIQNVSSRLRYGWWLLDGTDAYIQTNAVNWDFNLATELFRGARISFGYEVQRGTRFLTSLNLSLDYRTTQGIGLKFGFRKTDPNYVKDFDRALVLWRNIATYGLELDNYFYIHLQTNI